MNRKPIWTSALLSLLFLFVYGGCNWFTAHRTGVGSFYFQWERRIPFTPAMILPYLSIDLVFIAAPFLCLRDSQRQMLARRIAAAILIAGLFFLLMPLRFAFDRPQVGGAIGWIFNQFRLLDQPFNQFPSLHIALLLVLAPIYCERFRGWVRSALSFWFVLIASSTVLTYQHHVIDIVGGAGLALVCCHFIPESRSPRLPVIPNHRVGFRYLIGGICIAWIGVCTRPIGLILLWPSASLCIAAAGYFGVGPGIYRKTSGRVPMSSKLMLWPVLLGQHISLIYYRRQCRPWDQLTERVWIGRQLRAGEAAAAVRAGVTAVLDLTGEFCESKPFRSVRYLQVPMMDLTAPTPLQLDEAVKFILANTETGVVYVHCKVGYSRTAAVAGAYLLNTGMASTADQVIAMLRKARPSIIIRPEARQAIADYCCRRSSDRENDGCETSVATAN